MKVNDIRKRIPFAYWLAYDAVIGPLLIWGLIAISLWFLVGLSMFLIAVFFDINECIVKWSRS